MEGSTDHERIPRPGSRWLAVPCVICLLLLPIRADGQAVRTEMPHGWPTQQGQDQLTSLGRDSNWLSHRVPAQNNPQVTWLRQNFDPNRAFRLASTSSRRTTSDPSGEVESSRRVTPGAAVSQPLSIGGKEKEQVVSPGHVSAVRSPSLLTPREPQLTSRRQEVVPAHPLQSVVTSSRRTVSERPQELESSRRTSTGTPLDQSTQPATEVQQIGPEKIGSKFHDSSGPSANTPVQSEPQLTRLRHPLTPANALPSVIIGSQHDIAGADRRHLISPIPRAPIQPEPQLTSLRANVEPSTSFPLDHGSQRAVPAGSAAFQTAGRVNLGMPLGWPTQDRGVNGTDSTYDDTTWRISSAADQHEPQLRSLHQNVVPTRPRQSSAATGSNPTPSHRVDPFEIAHRANPDTPRSWPAEQVGQADVARLESQLPALPQNITPTRPFQMAANGPSDRLPEVDTALDDMIGAPDPMMMYDPVMAPDPARMSSVQAALKAQANDLFTGLSSVLSAPVFDIAVRGFLADEDPAGEPPLTDGLAGTGDQPLGLSVDGESLGQPPQDNTLQFLRRVAVLLPRGDWQADIGLTYAHFEQDFFDPLANVETNVRQRLMIVPLALRYGVTDRIQAFVSAPLGWANSEISTVGQDDFFNHFGIGDVSAGATILVRESSGCGCDPTITATFGFTAPTGQYSFLQSLFGNPEINLGSGFWDASWNVLFIHSHDPIVTFYGVGSRHQFDRMMEGVHVSPGDEYLYQFGVGFAVNESVTLSTIFLGQYLSEPYLNGTRLEGLIREPMRLRFAATIVNGCHCRILEPFATVGMTESAPSAQVGIVWTY